MKGWDFIDDFKLFIEALLAGLSPTIPRQQGYCHFQLHPVLKLHNTSCSDLEIIIIIALHVINRLMIILILFVCMIIALLTTNNKEYIMMQYN